MIKQSIKRRIVAIAVGLIILMLATSILSMIMVGRVGHLLDELTARYTPANAHLTRMNILSLERALALRRMVIAKMQEPPDVIVYKAQKQLYDAKDVEVDNEAQAARKLINAIIDDTSTPSDNAALGRIDSRIDGLMSDSRRHLRQTSGELLSAIDAQDFTAGRRILAQLDLLRDELDGNIDAVRAELLKVRYDAIARIRSEQIQAVMTSAVVTLLAAIVGLIFTNLVSGGIIRSVRRLLEGTRAVEAGNLDQSIDVTTEDEIGQLARGFNRMVMQLRDNQRVRETFGKYIDPRVVEGLIDRPNLTAAEGQHRVMTVLFCDMKSFTSLSEGMTPQGLVKVMNACCFGKRRPRKCRGRSREAAGPRAHRCTPGQRWPSQGLRRCLRSQHRCRNNHRQESITVPEPFADLRSQTGLYLIRAHSRTIARIVGEAQARVNQSVRRCHRK